MAQDFDEVRFPTDLSHGSSGGPERLTDVVTLRNGFEERNANWADSRRRYDAGLGLRTVNDLHDVLEFFEARNGRLIGFRWKDWVDFKSCKPMHVPARTDQVLGTGNGTNRAFQLVKTYTSGPRSYVRRITKPVAGTVLVAVDGVAKGFALDATTGLVTLTTAPAAGQTVTAGFEFDVPVRFDADNIVCSVEAFQAGSVPQVDVVEVRV